MISTRDIVWLAGWVEGEGSFGIHSPKGLNSKGNRRSHCAVVQGVTTDKDVADRVASLLGAKKYGPYGVDNPGRKPYYRISRLGNRAAAWMMTLYPLLGERRRFQIRAALARWQQIGRRGTNGSKYVPYPKVV